MKFTLMMNLGRVSSIDYKTLDFDRKLWDDAVEKCAVNGLDTILLDLGEGLVYDSHPELAKEGSVSKEYLKSEIAKLRSLGITIIPKLNFSASHDAWLGRYARMLSTDIYYGVVSDLIAETAELFRDSALLHLGLDEEDAIPQQGRPFICYRQGDLLWHDYDFYFRCVRQAGLTPACWSDMFWYYPEDCKANVARDVVMFPWYYGSIHKEHYRPVAEWDEWVKYYAGERFRGLDIKYVEQDPEWARQRESILPLAQAGYTVFPALSNFYGCRWNSIDVMEYCKENIPGEQLMGFLTAPWRPTLTMHRAEILESVDLIAEAKMLFYN